MKRADTFYITTPIYYVNDVPHIGHAYTTVAADVLARYWRLRGRDVFFLTGLDEHGQKVQQAAAKAGVDPQTYCDQLAPQFEELWKRLNIWNDAFIRTTEPQHKSVVQRCLTQLYDSEQKLIYKADYTGWYCTFDERFWTEKDVEDGLCPDCKRPIERLSEHNYFFKMGRYQEQLIQHIEEHPHFIRPESRRNEVLGFLRTQKLGDLSISRPKSRLSWGIELPFDHDYVTYVWFDALVNYISALEYKLKPDSPTNFWPANVHLIGKDILTTHAVYWSTILMALGLKLPEKIFAHGWWTVDGEKMSKSRGNVVDPNKIIKELQEAGVGGAAAVDAFRYFLLREVPFGYDGDFSRDALIGRINSDLANGLGNLLSRTLTMIDRYCGGKIPPSHSGVEEHENILQAAVKELVWEVDEQLPHLQFNRALELIWSVIQTTDQYLESQQPWKLARDSSNRARLEQVLYRAAEALRHISYHLSSFMPHSAEEIARQLGLPSGVISHEQATTWGKLLSGTEIRKGSGLFPRIVTESISIGTKESVKIQKTGHHDDATNPQGVKTVTENPSPAASSLADATTTTPAQQAPTLTQTAPAHITIDEFTKIQLKTATVLTAERVPKSEKLIKLQVDLGAEQRQIVAGIGKKYEPEALVGKRIVIVANLKPAKLMGIESQGMVLAAGDKEVGGLVTVLEDVEPGTKVK